MNKWIITSAILVGVLFGVFAVKSFTGGSSLAQTEVDWRLLGQMDYISKKASPELDALNGKLVKIPGFIVPLEDNSSEIEEFLLVPNPQACIHVPPPPPNQMVYVKMKKKFESKYGPVWVHGRLNLTTQKSMYGDSSFEMIGELVEAYK